MYVHFFCLYSLLIKMERGWRLFIKHEAYVRIWSCITEKMKQKIVGRILSECRNTNIFDNFNFIATICNFKLYIEHQNIS